MLRSTSLALAASCLCGLATAQTRLLRHPDVHGDRVVFTYGGDLWLAPIQGGTATRLTSAPGVELFAKFSPDGRWIAFTGQIDGDEQVYVVRSDGGEPRQLTWYPARGPLPARWGYDHQVHGWTPDGSAVLFRSLRQGFAPGQGRLYTVPMPTAARQRGALATPLPMPRAGAGEFSPDGTQIVYAPLFRDFRSWKRYQGGWAQDLYTFDPVSLRTTNISDHPRTDRDPMWIDDRIWFVSDRSGTLNLWSHDPAVRTTHQESDGLQWDVRWASAGGPQDHRIVYEKGFELCWFDTRTRSEQPIAIRVPDEGLLVRPRSVAAQGHVESIALGPGGRRAVFCARGDVLTVPREHGDVRNLTRTPGAHDKHAAFSPDGSTVAFVSDRSGEEQLWLVDHKGEQAPRQLTQGLQRFLYAPKWSPDGRWLLFGDAEGVLRLADATTGDLVVVADEAHGALHDFTWAPGSDWLAFTLQRPTGCRQIHLYERATRTTHLVSQPLADDRSPAFDERGERLFFLGLRSHDPRLAEHHESDFQLDRAFGVYALALQKDLGPLLPVRSDEAPADEAATNEATAANSPTSATTKTSPTTTRIDLDGLAARIERLPLPFDDYVGLTCGNGHLLCLVRPLRHPGRDDDPPASVRAFAFASRKAGTIADAVTGVAVSPDRTHLLLQTKDGYDVRPFALDASADTKRLDLDELVVDSVPADEHWQIFHEVWRRYRDFFYVANMHGHDWEALRDKYAPLVAHVRHRSDLDCVLGEMIAELNVGHAYVASSDPSAPPRPRTALLGVEFAFDQNSGRYRIDQVLAGRNDDPGCRSPATALGVQLAAGDYVLAIDGEDLSPEVEPYRLLRGKRDRAVTLTVNRRPQQDGARQVVLQPIGDESRLRHHAYVERCRQHVATRSDGKLGYLHLPDMGPAGLREFVRQYYPQRDRQGLVLDVRGNGGGFVSQMLMNRLQRELLLCSFGRHSGFTPYPRAMFAGHLACLIDETTASDGDLFAAAFRRAGLGKLFGKRTWGGVVGISDHGPLLDGGTVNVPEFGYTEPGPEWTIEGTGVSPDQIVDNDLPSVLAGRDPQLDAAIDDLLARIKKDPRQTPTPPKAPVKTGR